MFRNLNIPFSDLPLSIPFKQNVLRAIVACLLLLTSCATEFKPAAGVTVPKNLEQAYLELDRMLTDEQKHALKHGETEVEEILLTFGMQLKEYWGLWKDSKIAKYMRKRDVDHPDQMITVIFEGYVDYLKQTTSPGLKEY